MQQVDYRKDRRALSPDGSGPLPQFALPPVESFDPDRTLERVPTVKAAQAALALAPDVRRDDWVGPARAVDADLAITIELVPEIGADDILECVDSEPVSSAAPFLLSAPVSLPLDLDRLLAHARAEARRSPDGFQRATPPPVNVRSTSTGRPDPTIALSFARQRPRRRFGWVAATIVAASVATIAVAAGQSSVSSARSPTSVTVTRTLAPVAESREIAASRNASSDIPTIAVQSLPVAENATISLAAVAGSHRLFVDGRLAATGSALVSCGQHIVQVGSRGVRRRVNVRCGQELVVAN